MKASGRRRVPTRRARGSPICGSSSFFFLGDGDGATLNGMGARVIHVSDGGRLVIEKVHMTNGTTPMGEDGGCLLVGAGSSAKLVGSALSNCAALGVPVMFGTPSSAPGAPVGRKPKIQHIT